MKKILVVLFMIFSMVIGTALACPADPSATATATASPTITNSSSAAGGAGGIGNDNSRFTFTIDTTISTSTNKQKQQQGQVQQQKQNMNNNQEISPVQKTDIEIEARTPLLNTPSQSVPELNFGNGRMRDVTKSMPNFALYGIKKYAGEAIREVLYTKANIKMKNFFQEVINGGKKISAASDFKSSEVKVIVIVAEAQKTWTSGGNIGGAASGLAGSGLVGGSAGASIIPQWGGTKSDDLSTIFFVRVAN